MRLIPGRRLRLRGIPHEVEGVEILLGRLYISVCRKEEHLRAELYALGRGMRILTGRDVSLWGIEHAGGLFAVDNTLLLPLAEYRPRVRKPSRIVAIDGGLSFPWVLGTVNDHIGGLFYKDGLYYLFNWDSKRYYVMDENFRLLQVRISPVVGMQDFTIGPGGYVYSTIQNEDSVAVLRAVDGELELVKTMEVEKGDSTNGIAWLGDHFLMAWSDGKGTYLRKYWLVPGAGIEPATSRSSAARSPS